MKPVVASIGTTHPWNVAGVGRDILVISELGGIALVIVAGVSAQGGGAPPWREPIRPEAIAAQFAALATAPVGAFRVGALLDPASVKAVAHGLAQRPGIPVVYDPVITASDQTVLASRETIQAIADQLLPRATVATPNLHEAREIFGEPLPDVEAASAAASRLRERSGAGALLITGGHFEGEPVDVLAVSEGPVERFSAARLPGERRGTGCVLAAAMAYGLAAGMTLRDAVVFGRGRVRTEWEPGRARGIAHDTSRDS